MTRPYRGGPIPPSPELPANPHAVLFVRLSARGDVAFTAPLIAQARARWPDAHLTWVVEGPSRDLIEHHPDLDELIVWDRSSWKRLLRRGRLISFWKEWRALRRRLREREFSIAVDLQGLSRSAMLVWLSGAPIRIGLGSKEGSGPLMTHRFPGATDIDTMGGDYRDLAEWMGIPVDAWRYQMTLGVEAREGARSRLREAGIDGMYVLVIPHTTRPQKHWDEGRWGALIDELHQRTGWPVVMAGGPADRPASDRIAAASSSGALVDLAGRTTLGEAAGLVADAGLVVGVDTGLTHVAHYFDRKTVCLFGPAAYTVPPTDQARIIRHDELECVRCMPRGGKPTCGGAWWCMDRITRDEVMSHVDDLLEGRPDPRPPART